MPNIVKHTEFKKVVDALWNKVKGTFVTEVNYDANSSILKYVKNGLETEITNIITEWQDLEHVEQYQFANLLDLSKRIEGGHYNNTGGITPNATWSTVLMPVKASTDYTMLRKDNRGEPSRNIVFFNQDGSMVHYYLSPNTPSNGTYHYYTFTTTQDTAYLGISVPHTVSGSGLSCMIVESHNYATYGGDQIPYADGGNIQIGSLISHSFDNSNTNLSSATLSSAIKELDGKTIKSVNNQLPNNLGNVTVDATHINTLSGNSVENELNELSMLKVDKYKDSFIVDLTVDDIKLSNAPIKSFIPTGAYGVANERTLAGNRDTSVQQDIKVSKILVGVDGYLDGETVTGVEVYAVNKANNTIVERIVYEGIGIARKPKGYENHDIIYVDVEVNKSFPVEVYFIARLRKNGNKGMRIYGLYQTGIAFDKTTNDQELVVGSSIPIGSSSTRVPSIIVYGDGESLSNAIVNVELNNTNLNFKKANGSTQSITIPTGGGGTITSVNGERPQPNGDVILTSVITHPNNNILLQVGNQDFATLQCMTDQDATTIINGFTL